jgi:hypothetical protein
MGCTVELGDADAQDVAAYRPGDNVHVWWHAADEIRLPTGAAA